MCRPKQPTLCVLHMHTRLPSRGLLDPLNRNPTRWLMLRRNHARPDRIRINKPTMPTHRNRRLVALLREMQQHQMLTRRDPRHRNRGFFVAQMPRPAHDPPLQKRRTPRLLLHDRTIVRFNRQSINPAQMLDQRAIGMSQIRRIPHRSAGSIRKLNPNPKHRNPKIIMCKHERLDPHAFDRFKRIIKRLGLRIQQPHPLRSPHVHAMDPQSRAPSARLRPRTNRTSPTRMTMIRIEMGKHNLVHLVTTNPAQMQQLLGPTGTQPRIKQNHSTRRLFSLGYHQHRAVPLGPRRKHTQRPRCPLERTNTLDINLLPRFNHALATSAHQQEQSAASPHQ